jgi:hypothetical protein
MMRASGAMLTMTALQMATASLAVPKSVMKTMVGRGAAAVFDLPLNFSHEAFKNAMAARRTTNADRRHGIGKIPLWKKLREAERIQYTGGEEKREERPNLKSGSV